MSQNKLFVIAIGGTGMRCLESFVHLCAIGMFDNQEIEIFTLDTDSKNGNMGRVWNLIDLYNRVKTEPGNKKGGNPNADTFFSAKLNLYKFFTDYESESRITYRNISKLSDGNDDIKRQNQLLSDLFLEKESVQEFHLDHGYRAQTHLGSHLMYHSIVEAARRLLNNEAVGESEKNLEEFLAKLQKSGESARVFVFGSVFGGTGASSIPIIPVAFQDAIWIRSGEKEKLDLSEVKFGSTLLTEYFGFKKPDLLQMSVKKDSVIADSSFFPINSQAALQFYQGDPTVQSVYKRMYHVGWPLESKPLGESKLNQVDTGGSSQKNSCHIVELLCACAAFDFFTSKDSLSNEKAEYLFRSIEYDNGSFNFTGNDFVGDENKAGDIFMNKLGAFLSLAHISLSRNKAAWGDKGIKGFLVQLSQNKIQKYNAISDDETVEIDNYLKMFAYDFDGNKNFVPGWIYQIRKSAAPGKFVFSNDAFKENRAELEKIDVGALFLDQMHHWDKGTVGFRSGARYDKFVSILTNHGFPKEAQKVNTTKEQFLAHIYNGITISQNFNL